MKIGYYTGAESTETIQTTVEDAIADIKQGTVRKQIDAIRQLKAEGKEYKEEKKKLPGFTPSCLCKGSRGKNNISEYTGLVVTDIDHINEDIDTVRAIAYGLPFVRYGFISPSGSGIKILTQTDCELQDHADAVRQLADYYAAELDLNKNKFDLSGTDPARLCFESYDLEAYSNSKAEVFKVKKTLNQTPKKFETSSVLQLVLTEQQMKDKYRDSVAWANKYYIYANDSRNNHLYYLGCSLNRAGVPLEKATEMVLNSYTHEDSGELIGCIANGYKHKEEYGKYADVNTQPQPHIYKINYNDIELVNRDISHQWLVPGLFKRSGLAVIGGIQDTGKSNLLRHLCLSICCKHFKWLSYDLTPRYHRALIATSEEQEDDLTDTLTKQLRGLNEQATGLLDVIISGGLSNEELCIEIENHLARNKYDVLVIDSLSDLFEQDMNSAVNVRKIMKIFTYISQRHDLLIIFVHHLNKSSMSTGNTPHHKSLTGSHAISAKVRLAMQLTSGEGNEKFMTVTKCNYLGREMKQQSKVLHFEETTLLFSDSGMVESTDAINAEKRESKEDRLRRLADEIFDDKELTYTEIINMHQQINGTASAQAQRDFKAMKDAGIITKTDDGKKWKMK